MVHIVVIEENREKHIYYTNEAYERHLQGDTTRRANPDYICYIYPIDKFEF